MDPFVVRWEPPPGSGPTVAVKDLIDIAGQVTGCGSEAVTVGAEVAGRDAACVTAIRAHGGRIVGKTTLHELAFGGSGINPWAGTPTNPRNPAWIPGGSSSGSAVAVATGAVDVAFGTDTGGSVRTPSACCGTVGLKTTFGRLSLDGVYPLAPSMDTLGPMAATVAGVVTGMRLIEPAFTPDADTTERLGRFHLSGTNPEIDAAIDAALADADLATEDVDLPGWLAADAAGTTVVFAEAAVVNAGLLAHHAGRLGPETLDRLTRGAAITPTELAAARAVGTAWRAELDHRLAHTPVIATTAILDEPAPRTDPLRLDTRRPNVAINLSGHPAIVVPIPRSNGTLTAVQLIGRHGDEERLVTMAARIEAAVAASR